MNEMWVDQMPDIETDIVIIGAGAAGFAAALTAADRGAEVLLLEKAAEPGGSSRICGGLLAFAGTDLQHRNGIADSNDLLYRDLMEVGQDASDPALVRTYVNNQLDTYQWLVAEGVQFGPRPDASSGQSVPRCHVVDPDALIQTLARHAKAHPRIGIAANAQAKRLLRTDGRVQAVRVFQDNEEFDVAARVGAIVTSGGFTRNAELVRTFAPKQAKSWVSGGESNTGDGLLMAWQLGDCTWQIFDQPIYDAHEEEVSIFDVRHRHQKGMLVEARSLDELAKKTGLDPATLKDTVARYNANIAKGIDSEFGRKHLVHNHGALLPIATAPFYAHASTAALYGTYCGLTVAPSMQVLDVFQEPIDGLWAAGEVISGLHGAAYMTGSAFAKALIFGRVAGRSASR